MRRSPFFRPPFTHPTRPADSSQAVPVVRRQVGRSRVPLHRRLLTARSGLGYWVAVILLALATAILMSRLMDRADAAEHRFGAIRPVLVTTAAMRPGQRVTADNIALQDRPVAQLPEGALDELPRGASVAGPAARGEVLTRTRLQISSDLPSGTAAIAVTLGEAPLALRPGDHVDVYATYDPSLTPPGEDPTSRVALRAEVVRAGHASATVRVRDAEATSLAAAVARATVTVALVR